MLLPLFKTKSTPAVISDIYLQISLHNCFSFLVTLDKYIAKYM